MLLASDELTESRLLAATEETASIEEDASTVALEEVVAVGAAIHPPSIATEEATSNPWTLDRAKLKKRDKNILVSNCFVKSLRGKCE
jgi:hypothetical protein